MSSPSIAVIILTLNEAAHLRRAIASVRGLATEIFVIDSGSTDGTVDIAEEEGAHVLTHPFVSHARQLQWAIDTAPITADWIMRLDADEVIEPDLAATIISQLPGLGPEVTGVNLKRKHIFMGRWIRHGGRYPLILLRLWRRGAGVVEDRWMDEHVTLTHGRAVTFEGGFADINLGDLQAFRRKHRGYATREAVEILNGRMGLFDRTEATPSSPQAALKRKLKNEVYNRLPIGVGPTLYFLYRYVWRLGFLDGKEGAIYHGLQGFWYRLLVDARRLELQWALRGITDRRARLARLSARTGLPLTPVL